MSVDEIIEKFLDEAWNTSLCRGFKTETHHKMRMLLSAIKLQQKEIEDLRAEIVRLKSLVTK